MAGEKALPVLGSAAAPKRRARPAKVNVDLPGRGVRVVLQPKPIEEMDDLLDEVAQLDGQEAELKAVSELMVDPKMTVEQLRKEIQGWDYADWVRLRAAASRLSGLQEVMAQAEAFQDSAQ